ncbi:MAG: CocE/NonD family hydrolase, partial [Thiomicrorhabdus sp.]|nr:CocE/NonD family hydrolase [Thiomicrorhabdus sp.]
MKHKAQTKVITGPAGDIEVRVKTPKAQAEGLESRLAVISHPHPLYGGTMNNKVVTTMERAFNHLGYTTVAYNFRGVGRSQGAYDNGVGEQDDLKTVTAWAKAEFASQYAVLAGFSFGSYVTLQAHAHCQVDALCTVAPPVGLYDFSEISEVGLPWVLIQGGEDEVISAKEILDWAMAKENKPDLYWRNQASHFFHGELIWLRKVI